MKVVADLHIHSRFSRACSPQLTLSNIASTCAVKGIDLVATGDWTHPEWRREIGEQLEEDAPGVFKLQISSPSRSPSSDAPAGAGRREGEKRDGTKFLLGTELSCIYKHDGATRRVHHIVLAPSLAVVDRVIAELDRRGCNLRADGRPILGLSSHDLLTICLEADPRTLLIPAHAWTPWFAVFGSESGYSALAECFSDLVDRVPAVETGLSSDPPMNWRCSMLDHVALISSSDAHSLPNLGREATVLELDTLSFDAIAAAIRASAPLRYDERAMNRIIETIEFFPEEGKYHYDGHRACGVRCTPSETKRHRGICPQCAKPMTVGVLSRVDKLADRVEGFTPHAPSFRRIVPLEEIIAEAFNVASVTKRVRGQYERLTRDIGSEFHMLLDVPLEQLAAVAPAEVIEAIRRMRAGELDIAPGYDGEYGTVRVFTENRPRPVARQRALFS